MTLEKFQQIEPTLLKEFESIILQAAQKSPEGFKSWLQDLSEGPG